MQYRMLAITYCRAVFGANRAMLYMIKELRQRYDIETEVLLPSVVDGEFAEVLEKEGITYHIMPMKMWVYPLNASMKKLRSISAQIKSMVLCRQILRELKDKKYDLIYTNNSTVQYGAMLAAARKIPHIWHVREFGKYHYDFDYSYPTQKRIAYFRRAAAVVAISKAMARYAEKELCPGAHVVQIYDGIPMEGYASREKHFPGNAVKNIVYTGVLQPGKHQMELLQATALLKKKGRSDLHITLIGDGDDYRRELEEYVSRENISELVTFAGYQKNIKELLEKMDIGVICSRAEGFGLATCEYMAASLPVVGARSGATPELVENGVSGYIYEPGNIRELAESLEKLLDDPEKAESMGRSGRERVERLFDIRHNADAMAELILGACEK